MKKSMFFVLMSAAAMVSCSESGSTTASGLEPANFQQEVDGKMTGLYVLKNNSGMEVCVTNFGGRIVSVMVPDKNGEMRDVVLGFDNIDDYLSHETDFGATIGRYANRINQGRFTLDNVEYQLPQNNYGHCLHGGPKGFQYQVFDVVSHSDNEIVLSYISKDGEENFPGNLTCQVSFTLTDDNSIDINYEATTDKPTIVNMTNHSYFNLDGDPSRDNSGYEMMVNADYYTPVDSTFMTTGEIATVNETPMDFRTPVTIGSRIGCDFQQIKNGNGFDHNWVLNSKGDISKVAASLYSPNSGIRMEVYTTEPGIQVYCGNFLDGSLIGKKDIVYGFRAAVCMETQKYPDTPNKPDWPSARLLPGEKYQSRCIYKFSVEK